MIKVQSSEDDDSFVRREYTPENTQSTPRKLSIPVISISVDDVDNEGACGEGSTRRDDEVDRRIPVPKRKFSPSGPGEPEMIPDVLINVPPDASLESGGCSELPSSSSSCASYSIAAPGEAGIDSSGPGPPPQSPQGKFKPRPPPLVFANEILTSCSSKNSKDDGSGNSSNGSTSSTSSTSSSCCNSSCSSSSSSTTSTISSCSGTGGDNAGLGPPIIVIDEDESTCGDGGPTTTTNNTNSTNNNNNNNNNSDRSEGKVVPVESAVPVLSIEFATPVSEQLPNFVTSPCDDASTSASTTLSDKTPTIEVISCMAIPHIWDCPLAPPMITINQSSEAESDSDTTIQKSLLRRPNLNFLSPFASDTIRVPSESNLSTSGYSSMASPCASRCPSVSPLCSAEMDDYSPHHCAHSTGHGGNSNSQFLMRRASLTPSTPKKPHPSPIRRSSLNSGTPLMSFTSTPGVHGGAGGGLGLFDKRSLSEEKYEEDKKKLQEVDVETDSAFEIETDLECQPSNTTGGTLEELTGSNMTLSPPEEHDTDLDGSDTKTPVPQPAHPFSTPIAIYPEELKCINNLLQVPKKGFPKSRSLDINSTMINDSVGGSGASGTAGTSSSTGNSGGGSRLLLGHSSPSVKLKGLGPSLDSKLNSIDPFTLNAKLRNISGSSSVSSTSSGNGSGGASGPGITISLPLSAFPSKSAATVAATMHSSSSGSSGNFIEIPDDSCKDRRLSPVSSRSESPLSELSCTVGGRSYMACPGSPVTDSDGMYDYPSSEVLSNNNESQMSIPARLASLNKLSPQQQLRRSGRRKDRRLGKAKGGTLGTAINVPSFNAPGAVSNTNLPPPLIPSPILYTPTSQLSPSSEQQSSSKLCSPSKMEGETDAAAIVSSPVIVPSSSVSGTDAASSHQLIFPHIDLPPSLARESLVPVVAINKRASPKRRVRAQPALDVSSSSSESLSSRSR